MEELTYPPKPYGLGEFVHTQMRERGLGLRRLSELVNLPAAKLCNYLRGKAKTPPCVAADLAQVLGLSMGLTIHLQELTEEPLPDWEAIKAKERELEASGKLVIFRSTRASVERGILDAMAERLEEFQDLISHNGWSEPNNLKELEALLDQTDYQPLRKSAIRSAYMAYFTSQPTQMPTPEYIGMVDGLPAYRVAVPKEAYEAKDVGPLNKLLDDVLGVLKRNDHDA